LIGCAGVPFVVGSRSTIRVSIRGLLGAATTVAARQQVNGSGAAQKIAIYISAIDLRRYACHAVHRDRADRYML
jgi:hypothetical protein